MRYLGTLALSSHYLARGTVVSDDSGQWGCVHPGVYVYVFLKRGSEEPLDKQGQIINLPGSLFAKCLVTHPRFHDPVFIPISNSQSGPNQGSTSTTNQEHNNVEPSVGSMVPRACPPSVDQDAPDVCIPCKLADWQGAEGACFV